jgi:predicted RecA/RadA family phage recombinase
MTKAFRKSGTIVPIVAFPYVRTSGQGVLMGRLFGVCLMDVANGASGEIETTGVHVLAAVALQAWTDGAKLYWDDATKLVTTAAAAGANTDIGHAIGVKANGATATTGQVRLHGASI